MNKEALLAQVDKNVLNCQECRLYKEAKHGVPGEGNVNSPLVFIGEAPGAVEDATGRPFVGRAGKLLEQLLGEIGYKRQDVWIGNIIKHRPPGNRDPMPDEIKACASYLALQLKTIDPLLIVTLGRFAMHHFYKDGSISKNRGKLLKAEKYFIYPVYHPAAGLRNPSMLNALKEDFLNIPAVLDSIRKGDPELPEDDEAEGDQLSLF